MLTGILKPHLESDERFYCQIVECYTRVKDPLQGAGHHDEELEAERIYPPGLTRLVDSQITVERQIL